MSKKLNGYAEARFYEGAVGSLMKKHPPSNENAKEWLAFCRTVISGLQLLEKAALEQLYNHEP